MRKPTRVQIFTRRLIVFPAALIALSGFLVLLWSGVSWLLPVGRLVAALPDAVLGLVMLMGGVLVAFVFGRLSTPSGSLPQQRAPLPELDQSKR